MARHRPDPQVPDEATARSTYLAAPIASARPDRAGVLAPWMFWLAALAIGLASILAIMRLLDHADGRRLTQIVLGDIKVEASRLRLAELYSEIAETGDEAFEAAMSVAEQDLPAAVSKLLDLDPDGDAAYRVEEAVEQYVSNAREHFRLLGPDAAAWQWEQVRSGPSYELLQEATSESAIFYGAQARRSLRNVRLNAALAIGSEALLIGLLVGLSARSRRLAERKLYADRVGHAARFMDGDRGRGRGLRRHEGRRRVRLPGLGSATGAGAPRRARRADVRGQ